MSYTTIFWVCFCLWVYLLSVLKRAQLAGYYFILGSVGLFATVIFLGQNYLVWLFATCLTHGVSFFGALTGLFTTVPANIIQITHANETMSVYIDFECSGVIETAAFLGLISFYPLYTKQERLKLALFGFGYIYLANVLRILLIAIILHLGGSSLFYWAHSIIARLCFYILVVVLYYNIFTRSQIVTKLFNAKEVSLHK